MPAAGGFAIELNKADLANVQIALAGVKNGASRVLSRAINKTLDGVRTDSVNEIAKEITPTKKTIRGTFTVKKTSVSNLEGRTYSRGKPLGLIHYSARQTKKGVSVKVKRSGKRAIILGAFIAKAKGATNVFWRHYHGPKKGTRTAWRSSGRSGGQYEGAFPYGALPRKYRLPIERLTGPRIPDSMGNTKVIVVILSAANIRLDKNLKNQLDYELSKL